MANRERPAGQRPLEINPSGCLHRRVKIDGEALACVRCGTELHGVEYVAEMWATLWGIWQHCDPPPSEVAAVRRGHQTSESIHQIALQ